METSQCCVRRTCTSTLRRVTYSAQWIASSLAMGQTPREPLPSIGTVCVRLGRVLTLLSPCYIWTLLGQVILRITMWMRWSPPSGQS